nr:transformation/transcription domain-associated protein-like [Tanacetum cinerariifolium]
QKKQRTKKDLINIFGVAKSFLRVVSQRDSSAAGMELSTFCHEISTVTLQCFVFELEKEALWVLVTFSPSISGGLAVLIPESCNFSCCTTLALQEIYGNCREAIFLGGPLLSSNTNNSFKSRNGSSSNLLELDPLIFLNALVEVLADEDRLHAKSALNALNVFCETLPLLGQTCYQVNESYLFANSNGWGYRSWCISGKVTVEKGWISWGSYCDMAFKEAHDEIWLEYIMNCFIQAKSTSQNMWHHLAMFFCDELLSWSWRRPLGIPLAPVVGGSSMNPVEF